jgi:hypothetical protein
MAMKLKSNVRHMSLRDHLANNEIARRTGILRNTAKK